METAAIVITSCGKRKSVEPSAALRAGGLEKGTVAAVAMSWAKHLAKAEARVPARSLYQGRAFREAKIAARPLAAKVYIISAGLGLIADDHAIPAYSLTVANGSDNILSRFEGGDSEAPSLWWQELTRAAGSQSFEQLLGSTPGLVLIAAGGAYLSMIAPELAKLEAQSRSQLRLFTATPIAALPECLRPLVMPYDRRLEALPSRSGTMADFAQRSLRHFAETIIPAQPNASAAAHRKSVLESLQGQQAPERKRGKSMADAEIVALIGSSWDMARGKSGAMLRLLRDDFRVACEQGRFKRLFAQARAGRAL